MFEIWRHCARIRSTTAILSFFAVFIWQNPRASAQQPGKWELRAPMPSARTEVAAVELAGKIYVMGGYEKGGDLVEEYDPAKNSWRRRAALPKALHHTGAVAINGKIYVFGGYISGVGPVNTVYEYDPAADRWSSKKIHADGQRRVSRRLDRGESLRRRRRRGKWQEYQRQ